MDTKYIIVGQGFAGTALAWQLRARGKDFTLIDNSLKHSSSIASAGLINPITGLRLNHSKEFNDLKNTCDEFYHSLEKKLKIKCHLV